MLAACYAEDSAHSAHFAVRPNPHAQVLCLHLIVDVEFLKEKLPPDTDPAYFEYLKGIVSCPRILRAMFGGFPWRASCLRVQMMSSTRFLIAGWV